MKKNNSIARIRLILPMLLTLLCACTRVNEPTPEPDPITEQDSGWQTIAHEVLDSLMTYFPYDGVKKQYYTNGYGLTDSTCLAFPKRDSGTFLREKPDFAWIASVVSQSEFHGGEMKIEFDYIHEGDNEKTEQIYDYVTMQFADSDSTPKIICCEWGFGKATTAEERHLLWRDTVRGLNSFREDSAAYTVIVRHKGLVEYSFDGQEIWRLVE